MQTVTQWYTRWMDTLDEQDRLEGEGHPLPEQALICSLLLMPEHLDTVRGILRAGRGFESRQCGALYDAMLSIPYTGGPAFPDWVLPVCEKAGVEFVDVMTLQIEVPPYNPNNAKLYAQLIFARLLQSHIVEIASDLAQGASYDTVQRVDRAISDLHALRQRLAEVAEFF